VALALAVSKSPLFVAGVVAVANVGAVAVAWRIARRCWGPGAGLTAALLMALAPCAVFASRRVYAQDCVALFSGLILLMSLRVLERRKPSDAFWVIVLTACLIQIHFSGLAVAAALVLAWAVLRPRLSWRAAGAGLAVSFLLYLPYLIHMVQSDFLDLRLVLKTIALGDDKEVFNRLWTWAYAFNLAGDADVAHILDNAYAPLVAALPATRPLRWAMNTVVAVAFVLQIPVALPRLRSRQTRKRGAQADSRPDLERARARLFLLWGLTPLALYSSMKLLVVPSYLFILYPLPCLMGGWAAAALARPGRWRNARLSLGVSLLAAWSIAQAAFLVLSVQRLDRAEGLQAPYATYRDQLRATRFIAERLLPGRTQVRQNLWLDKVGIEYNYLYLMAWHRGFPQRDLMFAAEGEAVDVQFYILEHPCLRLRPAPGESLKTLEGLTRRDFGSLSVYYAAED
jgi:4-amino-4-deoxy-L-arabinose transferase-like glycosyltransferase